MSELPEFSDNANLRELVDDDPLSNSPIKGAIKWNQRDNQYDFIWWQTPLWIASENGGYSMTLRYFEDLPEHVKNIWVVDDKTYKFKMFTREQYEDGVVIDPDDPRFENVAPEEQVAVDKEKSKETYDLGEVEV